MKRSGIAFAVIGLFAASAAYPLDLVQAYKAAETYDAQLASSRSQLEATREKIIQARAGLLPNASLNAALTRNIFDTDRTDKSWFTTKSIGVQLAQPLYRPVNVETLEQSKLLVSQAEAAYAGAVQDLIVRVSQAYFDALAAQDTLQVVRAQKRAIVEQFASAKRQFEVGTATVTDQQEAQARLDLNRAQEIQSVNDLEAKKAALALLIGRQVEQLKTLQGGVAMAAPQPARELDWVSAARDNNYTVQQTQLGAEVAKREIDRARYAHYPTVDLVGNAQYADNPTAQLNPLTIRSLAAGVQLSVPLYAGGAIDSRVREAVANHGRALADTESARRQAELAARQAFLGVNNGLAQVAAFEAAEKSSRLALESNQLGYQVGVRISIDVLNAQQQLFQTRKDLAKARYDVLVGGLRLKSTTGSLKGDDLIGINSLLTDAVTDAAQTPVPPSALPSDGVKPAAPAGADPGKTPPGTPGMPPASRGRVRK